MCKGVEEEGVCQGVEEGGSDFHFDVGCGNG